MEDEYHILFSGPVLQTERSSFYVKHVQALNEVMLLPDYMNVKWLIMEEYIDTFEGLL